MSNGGSSPTESPKGELTQRITIGGEVYEVIDTCFYGIGENLKVRIRKIEPPKEKESEGLWAAYAAAMTLQGYELSRIDRQVMLDKHLSAAIKAEIREELPEMLKELGK